MTLSIAEQIVLEDAQKVSLRDRQKSLSKRSKGAWLPSTAFGTDIRSPLQELLSLRASFRDLGGTVPFKALQHVLNALTVPVEAGRWRLGAATTGGLNAQKVLCIVSRVEGIDPGVFEVDWSAKILQPLEHSFDAKEALLEKVSVFLGSPDCSPAIVMLCVADWDRLNRNYQGATLVSGLWDAGIMLGHLYLAAVEAKLGCCAVSALDDGTFLKSLGLDVDRWGHIGTFALGNPTDELG